MVLEHVEPHNKGVIVLLGTLLFLAGLIFTTFPLLREAVGIYGFLIIIALAVYTNADFQEYLVGLKISNLPFAMLLGLFIAAGFFLLSAVIPGFSIGLPLVPYAVSDAFKFIIIGIFAPIVEEAFTRGALIGFIIFAEEKNGSVSKLQKGIAIVLQMLFFVGLHALAYFAGWYEAPTAASALLGFSAVSGALIAAGVFALVAGIVVTRKRVNNLAASMVAHFLINSILFVKFSVVGFTIAGVGISTLGAILISISLSAIIAVGIFIYRKKKLKSQDPILTYTKIPQTIKNFEMVFKPRRA